LRASSPRPVLHSSTLINYNHLLRNFVLIIGDNDQRELAPTETEIWLFIFLTHTCDINKTSNFKANYQLSIHALETKVQRPHLGNFFCTHAISLTCLYTFLSSLLQHEQKIDVSAEAIDHLLTRKKFLQNGCRFQTILKSRSGLHTEFLRVFS